MNNLLRKETPFLRLLLTTTYQQQKAMIKTITPSQMKAVAQIAYNVLQGNRELAEKDKKKLQRDKLIIRRFIAKGLAREKTAKLLLKYLNSFLLLIKVIKKEL